MPCTGNLVCFDCRSSTNCNTWRLVTYARPWLIGRKWITKCPQCQKLMRFLGPSIEPPPKSKKIEWKMLFQEIERFRIKLNMELGEEFDGSPRMNIVVIRALDINASKKFYEQIGLTFKQHKHGKGAVHYASESPGFVFEIYPDSGAPSSGARVGFAVSDVDSIIKTLQEAGAKVVAHPLGMVG